MEGEKGHWDQPSTSKAGQHEPDANENQQTPTPTVQEDQPSPSYVIFTDKRVFGNECAPFPVPDQAEHIVAFQDEQTPASTSSAPNTQHISTTNPVSDLEEDGNNVQRSDTPSESKPLEERIPASPLLSESEDGGKQDQTDTPVVDTPWDSKAMEQRVDLETGCQAIRKLTAVEIALAEIFHEMTGEVCDDHTQWHEMTTSKNSSNTMPLFHDFLDLFENEMESADPIKDAVEVKDEKVEAESLPPTPAAEPAKMLHAPRDPEKVLHKHLNKIQNPSPSIQKQKLKYEKDKHKQFTDTLAMKIMEKMILSSMYKLFMSHQPQQQAPPGDPLDPKKLDFLAQKVDELEKRLKQLDREKRESERAKRNLLDQLNELELRTLEKRKMQLMTHIASCDEPSEKDMKVLDHLNALLKHQDETSKELKELERQNRVMERVLSRAEKTLLSSGLFRCEAGIPSTGVHPVASTPSMKKLRFQHVGTVVHFDNRDPPYKVPHCKSGAVQELVINSGDHAWESTEIDAEVLEEKMVELRRKKEEEKLVKVKDPLNVDEEEEEVVEEEEEEEDEDEGSKISNQSNTVTPPTKE